MDGEVSHERESCPSGQILVEREATHGCFADVAKALKAVLRRGAHWDALSDRHREALQMISTKLSRVVNGDPGHRDHWADIADYAELAQENG